METALFNEVFKVIYSLVSAALSINSKSNSVL